MSLAVTCMDSRDNVLSRFFSVFVRNTCQELRSIAAGLLLFAAYCWPRLQANTEPISVKCWASVAGAGQYPFCPSQ